VHRGKAECLAVLKLVKLKTNRQLLEIKDVTAGQNFGAIIATERFEYHGKSVELERILRYRVSDDKLVECWIHDQDQELINEILA
jgi:uncharacterized protein